MDVIARPPIQLIWYDDTVVFQTCRYIGPPVLDLFIPGGVYIIINNIGAFPRIQDRNGNLYVINTKHYQLIDVFGNCLSDTETALFLERLTMKT
jgi:hypothetical protein